MIISAWPGCGKTTFVKQNKKTSIEIECWTYPKKNFPCNIINDIVNAYYKFKYIMVSTNPIVLKEIIKLEVDMILYYPNKSLKYEYLERYIQRKSAYDFIGAFMSMWDTWLDESKNIECPKVEMNSGEYLSDIMNK